jgi:hypothetical protein
MHHIDAEAGASPFQKKKLSVEVFSSLLLVMWESWHVRNNSFFAGRAVFGIA